MRPHLHLKQKTARSGGSVLVEMGRIELPSELGCLRASTVCRLSQGLSNMGMRQTESHAADP